MERAGVGAHATGVRDGPRVHLPLYFYSKIQSSATSGGEDPPGSPHPILATLVFQLAQLLGV